MKKFMDCFARDILDLEYYWGRVNFAPSRSVIHVHLLAIAKDKAYLNDFYQARGEKQKVEVLEKYATEIMGMTANVKLDEDYKKFDGIDRKKVITTKSPLGGRYSKSKDANKDHVHFVQDAMLHPCNDFWENPTRMVCVYVLVDLDLAKKLLLTKRIHWGSQCKTTLQLKRTTEE